MALPIGGAGLGLVGGKTIFEGKDGAVRSCLGEAVAAYVTLGCDRVTLELSWLDRIKRNGYTMAVEILTVAIRGAQATAMRPMCEAWSLSIFRLINACSGATYFYSTMDVCTRGIDIYVGISRPAHHMTVCRGEGATENRRRRSLIKLPAPQIKAMRKHVYDGCSPCESYLMPWHWSVQPMWNSPY